MVPIGQSYLARERRPLDLDSQRSTRILNPQRTTKLAGNARQCELGLTGSDAMRKLTAPLSKGDVRQ
jgi:hypothetical protein